MKQNLITVREAAERAGVSKGTIHRWIKLGHLDASDARLDSGQPGKLVRAADVDAMTLPHGGERG